MQALRQRKTVSFTLVVMLMIWSAVFVKSFSHSPHIAYAAQVNSYSTLGTISYDAGACGVDETAGVVSSPGIKKILKVSNTEMYVAGCFTNFSGVATADYVAKWDGTSWSGLGASGDINAIVHDIVIYKNAIHIAGEFTDAGGDVAADMVARWSGSAWVGLPVTGGTNTFSGLGSPKDSYEDYATALKVQENNAGTSDDILLVGGKFYYGINNGTSGFPIQYTKNIATWNSTSWGSIDTDSEPFITAYVDYVVHDIEIVGSSIYASGYRNSASCSSNSTNRKNSFHKFDGTTWSQPITAISCAYFGSGFGIYTMEVVGTNIYVGGTFTSLSSVADHFGVYSTTSGTFSAFNTFAAQYGNGAVVRSITTVGSQVFIAGSFPGVTGTSGAVARWTGESWQGIGRNAPTVVNAVLGDSLYSGSDSRLLMGAAGVNIGGIAAADGFAALDISGVSTLDALSVDAGTLTPTFDPAVTSYSLTIPNISSSVTFTALASASGAAIKRTNVFGTIAMSSDTEVLSVSDGATENISFAVSATSGASTTTYSIAVTRSPVSTTTAAPSTTAAPTTTASPATTSAPTTTASPATTSAPTTTASPATTTSPATTSAPVAATTPATTATTATATVVPPTTVAVQPVISSSKTATAASLAKYAKVSVPSGAKISVKVLPISAKYCKVLGTSVKGIKRGTCKVTLTVTPKKGSKVLKTIVLKIN